MDFAGLLTSVTAAITENTPVMLGLAALVLGPTVVYRLVKRFAR